MANIALLYSFARLFLLYLLKTPAHASIVYFSSALDPRFYNHACMLTSEIFMAGSAYAHMHILADHVTLSIN